jgi:general secretion pathway protein D
MHHHLQHKIREEIERGKHNHMGGKAHFWMKIFILCLAFGMISYPGLETGLRAEPTGQVSREQVNNIFVIQRMTPVFDVVAQASPSQPSTPAPSEPPTTLQPPTSTPVQPSEVPTPKPTPPLQLQPSPTPSTPTPPPSPSPPSQLPSLRRRLAPQPSTSPKTQPPTTTTQPAPTQGQPTPPTPAPVATPPSPPVSPTPPRIGSGVVFNFDNADIYEVIRVMAEILKINYIVDARVKGVVNIHTSGQISTEDTFPIFQSILRLNGATAVKKDGIYEIVPLSDAKKLPISPSATREPGKPPSEEKYIIQIVSLKYIPVAEVSKMIKPFLSDGADIVEHPPHNILIIGDLASNVKKSVDIISLFDLDIFTDLRVRIYPILNADVNEVAKEMERIFTSFEVSTKSGRGVGITFTPVVRINSLLVVSSIPNIFEKVEGWLKELDKIPVEGTKYSVFVYYVQNAKAKDLAEVLKQIYVTAKEKKGEFKEKVTTPEYPKGVKPPPTPSATTPSKEEGGAVPEGEINIVVDEATNSLVIRAFARDYKSILETVKKLDLYPKQVLIEALLAEITLDDSNKFGVEWARFIKGGQFEQTFSFGTTPTGAGGTSLSLADAAAALPGAGVFRYSIVEGAKRLSAAISLAATDNRLKVISSPHLIASNNKEAKIQVGSSQPILTSTYAYGSSTTTPGTLPATSTTTPATGLLEGTIEYKDIGIIVTITPRISDGGLITLELQIEKSDVNAKALPLGNLSNVPVFTKKTAKTVLSVLEGQTIVIGGLIEESKNVIKSGIPILSKIPILGALFGSQEYTTTKSELVLLLTPHIITDHIQSRSVTEEFKERVEGLKKELEKERMKREKK